MTPTRNCVGPTAPDVSGGKEPESARSAPRKLTPRLCAAAGAGTATPPEARRGEPAFPRDEGARRRTANRGGAGLGPWTRSASPWRAMIPAPDSRYGALVPARADDAASSAAAQSPACRVFSDMRSPCVGRDINSSGARDAADPGNNVPDDEGGSHADSPRDGARRHRRGPCSAADPPVLRYVPKHEELAYTFGGVAPVATSSPARGSSRGPRTATTVP